MFVSDKSAITGFLGGVVILVVAGSLLSKVTFRQMSGSANSASAQREIAELNEELPALRRVVERERESAAVTIAAAESLEQELATLNGAMARQSARRAALLATAEEMRKDVQQTAAAGRTWRDRYRKQVRSAAEGEKIPSLTTRSGKALANLVIKEVNAQGITFRHDAGVTRLTPSDLGPEWTERFQWDREELEVPPAAPVAGKSTPKGPVAATKIGTLQQSVYELKQQLRTAESKLAETRKAADASNSQSVPGSVETWTERLATAERTAQKLRRQYEAAQQDLAAAAQGGR